MHEKCVEFVVEYCKQSCPTWSKCIAEGMGFDKPEDRKDLLFCLINVEHSNAGEDTADREEEFEIEVAKKWAIIEVN